MKCPRDVHIVLKESVNRVLGICEGIEEIADVFLRAGSNCVTSEVLALRGWL